MRRRLCSILLRVTCSSAQPRSVLDQYNLLSLLGSRQGLGWVRDLFVHQVAHSHLVVTSVDIALISNSTRNEGEGISIL